MFNVLIVAAIACPTISIRLHCIHFCFLPSHEKKNNSQPHSLNCRLTLWFWQVYNIFCSKKMLYLAPILLRKGEMWLDGGKCHLRQSSIRMFWYPGLCLTMNYHVIWFSPIQSTVNLKKIFPLLCLVFQYK